MRLILTSSLLFFICLLSFSQTHFEKGYFIKNNNEKINCLIRNDDWKNTPKSFVYKLTENDTELKETAESVKEFAIDSIYRFFSFKVNVDHSSNILNKIPHSREPEFTEELIFMKQLVQGKVKLYHYYETNFHRYFIQTENNNPEQLIYKLYRNKDENICENEKYKQQLLNTLNCECLNYENFKNLSYTTSSLVRVFSKYHECSNINFQVFEKRAKKTHVRINAKGGIGLSFVETYLFGRRPDTHNFGSNFPSYHIAAELEAILPFRNNKWALSLEPALLGIDFEGNEKKSNLKFNYKSFDTNIGVKHYFYLNNNTSIYLSAYYTLIFPIQTDIRFHFTNPNNPADTRIYSYDVSAKYTAYSMGAGIKKDKLYAELRYGTGRDALSNHSDALVCKTLSIMVGYNLFESKKK